MRRAALSGLPGQTIRLQFLRLSLLLLVILGLTVILAVLPASAQAAGRTPVIIIPGIAGSTFKTGPAYTFYEANNGQGSSYQHTYGSNETVWVNAWEAALPGSDDYFDTLRLQPDGDTPYVPYSNLFVSGIYQDAYSDLVDFLHRQGYVDNVTLFTFAYDWRRDIARATYSNLDNLVNQAKAAAGTGQVDLIAHSMGGLVARNYINASSTASAKIRRLIAFGTPFLGSPKFLKTLLYGDQFGPSFLGLGLDPNEVKDLVQDMSGGWQLLPSRAYYNFYDNTNSSLLSPYREDRDVDGDGRVSGVLNYSGVSTFLRNLGKNQNTALAAQNFHDKLDNSWPVAGPRISVINGSGLATLGQVRDYTGSCWSWFRYVPCPKTDILNIDGDGTVPYFSATPADSSHNLNLLGETSVHIVNREHGALVQYDKTLGIYTGDGPSLSLLGQILNNNLDPITTASASLKANNSLNLANPLAPNSAKGSAKRIGLSGYSVSVTDDVQLEIYDSRGNHTGKRKDGAQRYEQNIAGSSLEVVDGTRTIYLPEGGQYRLNMTASASGSFDLKIRMLEGENISQTLLYLNVPVQAGEQAEMEFGSLKSKPALPVLRLGDKKLKPTTNLDAQASLDRTAPTVSLLSPQLDSSGRSIISWQAEDKQSGLLLEQAVLDPASADPQIVKQGERVRLAKGLHTLQVLAQDRAGNTVQQELSFTVL